MAKVKSIRNIRDYEDALKEIDRLWEAEEGSPEAKRLAILSDLVEAWEMGDFDDKKPRAVNRDGDD